MKKTILALCLAGSCNAVFAQVTQDSMKTQETIYTTTSAELHKNHHTIYRDTSLTATGDYSAYGVTSATVPSSVQGFFDRDYPTAGTVTWRMKGPWYHATYNKNGRYSHVYYNDAGKSYKVSLPVTQNYVPDDIIARVSDMFGDMVYDVATIKGSNGKDLYHVRTLENGEMRSQWIGDDGATVTDPYRNDSVATDWNTSSTGSNPANSSMQDAEQSTQINDTSAPAVNSSQPVNREQTPLVDDQMPINEPMPAGGSDENPSATDPSSSAVLDRKQKSRNYIS